MIQQLFDDLYIIEGIGSANVFLLKNRDGFSLLDTGIFMKTGQLIQEIEQIGLSLQDLTMIYLTHCHCDHIGGVSELVTQSGAKVAAHEADIPYILQERVIDGPYHSMMVQEQKAMLRLGCKIKAIDVVLKDGEVIVELGGLQVINCPGHTPGSVALYQDERRIMFFGDVIRNNEKKGLTIGIPEEFNLDTDQTRRDARRLLEFPIEFALFNHGKPIVHEASAVLSDL